MPNIIEHMLEKLAHADNSLSWIPNSDIADLQYEAESFLEAIFHSLPASKRQLTIYQESQAKNCN